MKLGNQQQNRAGNGPRVNITHLLGAGSGCCVGLDKIQAMGSEYSESREGTGIILRCWKRLASVVRASHYAITVGHGGITISRSFALIMGITSQEELIILHVSRRDCQGGSSHSNSDVTRNYS